MILLEHEQPAPVPLLTPEPAPGPVESSGVVAVVMDFVGATLPQFDRMLQILQRNAGPGRVGSLFQWSRSTPDGVRVTEVWQSHQHFEVFLREQIQPHLDEAGLRQPEITTYEVHSYLNRGPGIDPQFGVNRSEEPLRLAQETSL